MEDNEVTVELREGRIRQESKFTLNERESRGENVKGSAGDT